MSSAKPALRIALEASLALFCGALVGCSFGSNEVMTLANGCAGEGDCVQGVCDQGICIDDSSSEVTVAVQVLRGSADTKGETPAGWTFIPETFSRASERDYTLPPIRQVVGVVRWQGAPVPATLRFTRRMGESVSALSAVPVEVDTVREASAGNDPNDVDYSAVLVVGQSYDVAVVPSNDLIQTADQSAAAIRSLPPMYTSVELDDVIDGAFRFDVRFPDALDVECAMNQLSGCTLTGTVLSFDGQNETPAVGLQVHAVEKESGRVISSIGETTQSGDFAIRVSDQAAPYVLRVTSSVGGASFPSVSVDIDLAFINDPAQRRILVPSVAPVQSSGAVRDGEGRGVQGASVRFSSSEIFEQSALGLVPTFSAATKTSGDGSFSLELLPGLYTVIVTPPEDAENAWAPLAAEVLVVEDVELEDLVLPSQIALSGSCTTFAGDPAGGVAIVARARGELGELQRSRLTASNQEGMFRLTVDAGRYDMLIKVTDVTGFPWLVEPELVMSQARGDMMRDYTLPPPIVVRGTLRAASGAVAGGAQIRAYVFEEAGGAARPIQVAETISADDGSYRLLISPTLDGI
ncbi:MAG: carboxypeptidase-like regulatory domain-containing protein [Myxococcales bacterium]|nr:carboxypeptidase-like regulatory domain-containing protein [Myxococcales bacterium]MDH3484796.1 carboxypeptidase-like regulatory domain-containing protein [Myxococcales bacterium]